jgi:hypothetical protein
MKSLLTKLVLWLAAVATGAAIGYGVAIVGDAAIRGSGAWLRLVLILGLLPASPLLAVTGRARVAASGLLFGSPASCGWGAITEVTAARIPALRAKAGWHASPPIWRVGISPVPETLAPEYK